jgi:hypothetical protein
LIAKIEHHLGELFPRVGFIVTTLIGMNRAVVRFYNQRGTAEQWITLRHPELVADDPSATGMPGTSLCSLPKAT